MLWLNIVANAAASFVT